MIHELEYGGARVWAASIPSASATRLSRRQLEKQAVAGLLASIGIDPGTLGHDEHGAPALQGHAVSITHSQSLAAVALAPVGTPIGVDAERWRPALLRVMPRFLSEAELARLGSALPAIENKEAPQGGGANHHENEPNAEAQSLLLRLWTIKEAVFKAAAKPGLPFTAIETSPELDTAYAEGRTYRLRSARVGSDIITLAIEQIAN